jgi:transcriptional regulator with XRE-family HTH domain
VENVVERFARNLADLRRKQGLNQSEVSARLNACGVPLRLNLISRLENGARVADVPELLALAVVLDVTPNRLLLTADATDEQIELTPTVAVPSREAWAWAAGDHALGRATANSKAAPTILTGHNFAAVNRPHDPTSDLRVSDVLEHEQAMEPLVAAIEAVATSGVPVHIIFAFLDMWRTARTYAPQARALAEQAEQARALAGQAEQARALAGQAEQARALAGQDKATEDTDSDGR